MKRIIILILFSAFLFSSCGIANKNCAGNKKIKSEMW